MPSSLTRASNASDAALLLAKLARALIDATARVERWATLNEPARLDMLAAAIAEAHAELRAGLLAQSEADRPSIAQLEWRVRVAGDRCERLSPLDRIDLNSPGFNDAEVKYDAAYKDYLQARRELRAHPDYRPKKPKKTRRR